ncbi:MAG: TonB-dependent receptor plug domain-containing protein, partial [Paracoccaceae bacterium]
MKRLAVSLIAILAALPAQAQDIELSEIVISALRTAVERIRTGVSVSVVDQADLDAARDTSLANTLARLPGVSVTQSGPIGSTSTLRVRGADGKYLAVFVDGIKLSDPSG